MFLPKAAPQMLIYILRYHSWKTFLPFSPASSKSHPKFPNFQATCQGLDKSLRRLGNGSGVEETNNRVHNICWHLLISNHSLHSGDLPFLERLMLAVNKVMQKKYCRTKTTQFFSFLSNFYASFQITITFYIFLSISAQTTELFNSSYETEIILVWQNYSFKN